MAILVGEENALCSEKLSMICFVLNTAKCDNTGQTAICLLFGTEPHMAYNNTHDLCSIVSDENFVSESIPCLRNNAKISQEIKDFFERQE